MKMKIALVNQRYGLEVNGGSEYYTRLVGEKLNNKYEVEILTTKALDYSDWANHYDKDVELINGLKVHRFPVEKKRASDFYDYTQMLISDVSKQTMKNQIKWFEDQGPYSPQLIQYIENNVDKYDVFIFVTYLYYPSVMGLSKVANKSIFIPTAHDEPYIHFSIFKEIFSAPKSFIFLTEEERDFVHKTFNNDHIRHEVLGVGVDIPSDVNHQRAIKKYQLIRDYIIYAGRIDTGKNCDQLLEYFIKYAEKNPELDLILVGKAVIDIPNHKQIKYLGFVSEQDKFDLIQGAKILVLPSMFESLSIAVLEALALKTPILVNEKSEVLKGHVLKSNAGLYYSNYLEFEACIHYFTTNRKSYQIMKQNGIKYVESFYNWESIIKSFSHLIEYASGFDV